MRSTPEKPRKINTDSCKKNGPNLRQENNNRSMPLLKRNTEKHENTSPQTAAGSAKRKGKENKKHPSVLAQTLAAT
jgi:hypothetical protein